MGTDLPTSVEVAIEMTVGVVVGVFFTTFMAFLGSIRCHRLVFGAVASVPFCGACLLIATQWMESALDCFRWHFVVYSVGLSVVAVGLCVGGLSSVLAFSDVLTRRSRPAPL